MISLFWISLCLVCFTYIGYGLLLFVLIRFKRIFSAKPNLENSTSLPTCTVIVAAYNEEDFILAKIKNTLDLEYPAELLKFLFVADGSNDQTAAIISQYPSIQLLHEKARLGKVAAVHRAVSHADSEILVFTDANTLINKQALINLVRHYSDKKVGAVAGEKRVRLSEEADAGSAGEGFYWKYESTLKKWDYELYSVVGAAGELFSVRRALYEAVPADTILDDFMISMLIAKKGYKIAYEPDAYAIEDASENITEELKRKIRIAAGGIQSIIRLIPLLNLMHYGLLSFQYISHRVLRWTICPFLLILIFFLNTLIISSNTTFLYEFLLGAQILFYSLAILGYLLEKRELRIKIVFIPYYFCVMNYAVMMGIMRYFSGKQSAVWDKAQRKSEPK